ncbi:MAG: hypothetical protein LBD06_05665 [Candidatus Accumulibacter sp.]|jgi:hypothetical protein|nr:hypothetical protein [Accumulibacter sp.]
MSSVQRTGFQRTGFRGQRLERTEDSFRGQEIEDRRQMSLRRYRAGGDGKTGHGSEDSGLRGQKTDKFAALSRRGGWKNRVLGFSVGLGEQSDVSIQTVA